ncbi:hypothetical protein DFQ28_008542 [Apophysomyces sp. BC1034]|nr:hypothetical protein DFQ30_008243 [Apophysomyces sp. BC1015]KAG0174728.1 hypothetical protein DFQ29_007392 [Apophysomyces sp. BC1021]KAG0185935.1 hypothetical protein DFQ28_008542 [Apophysomyces sp. BC1034]
MALKRIQRELVDILRSPTPGITVVAEEDNVYRWKVLLSGPENSAYKGGTFKLDINFSPDYPFKPPTIKFLTKIYHPNIDDDGAICLDLLKADVWKPATKVIQILEALTILLREPNPDDALVASIAEVYNSNRTKFRKLAKEYVDKYAFSTAN